MKKALRVLVVLYFVFSAEPIGWDTNTAGADDVIQDADVSFKTGTNYLKNGKWREAEQAFEHALSLAPHHTGAHFNKGCALALAGEYEKAVEEFEKALMTETSPFNAFCYFNIAGVYAKQAILEKKATLFKKAAESFRRATDKLPNFILATDYARHSEMFAASVEYLGKIEYAVGEMGIPPDSGMFLRETNIIGGRNERVYMFDGESPPPLYFFRSPSCHMLICEPKIGLQNLANLSEEGQACLKTVLNLLEGEPDTQPNRIMKKSTLLILSNFYRANGDYGKATELGEKANAIELTLSP